MDHSIRVLFVALVILFSGCVAEKRYKDRLIPDSKREIEKNLYGAYIELKAGSRHINGELITISQDSVYIMTYAELQTVPIQSVSSLEIFLTQNGSKKYLRRSAITWIPAIFGSFIYPEYAGGFLLAGLFGSAWGGLAALVESGREPTILTGPTNRNDLSEYWKYSRFPFGIPENYDLQFLPVPVDAKRQGTSPK